MIERNENRPGYKKTKVGWILKDWTPSVFAKSVKLKTETEVTPEATPDVTPEVKRLLNAITGDHSRKELQEMLGLKDDEHFRKTYFLPAIKTGFVEMTRPDKPKSRFQKYRLTEIGQAALKELAKAGK